jgi:hypothetical protein
MSILTMLQEACPLLSFVIYIQKVEASTKKCTDDCQKRVQLVV